MRFFNYLIFFVMLSLVLFTNCAKRGTIDGGPKDTLAPIILSTSPENFSTHFNAKTIQINFDEYVKLNKVNQQLIISPPMETQPEITPMGYPSKYIRMKIYDTLKPNTTYSFNFGESIQDNNEGNPYTNYKYVFSTGSYIDSLTLKTTFQDAYSKAPLGRVNVLLYEAEGFNDSTVYKKKPLYVASSLDSIKDVTLENLKEGAYYLLALEEKNSNYKFDPKGDKIAYIPQKITIPNDSIYHLNLFKEAKLPNAYRPSMVSQNKWLVGFEGNIHDLKVRVSGNNQTIPTAFSKVPNKDSIYVYTPLEKYDSLSFHFTSGTYEKNYSVTPRTVKPIDTLQLKFLKSGTLHFRDTITLSTNTPIKSVNKELIQLIKKDSTQVAFSTKIDSLNNSLKILFDLAESEKYTLSMLPNSIVDFYDKKVNDTLTQSFQTGKFSDYGNITFQLSGTIQYPIIFELLSKDEKRYDYQYITKEQAIVFQLVEPSTYFVRIIEDRNENKKWDTGNYLQKTQPEKVIHFPTAFEIRANWEKNETLVLP
ncbi:MAG TPA: Ig-like domain-containing protein [Flavobacterium sp.]|nr:Ig-like domain-containing protein [Flavobacterium sp.]